MTLMTVDERIGDRRMMLDRLDGAPKDGRGVERDRAITLIFVDTRTLFSLLTVTSVNGYHPRGHQPTQATQSNGVDQLG